MGQPASQLGGRVFLSGGIEKKRKKTETAVEK